LEITSSDIKKLIDGSGYPFELRVTQKFFDRGYNVKPSYRFLDESREKDVELDLVASKNEYVETVSGKKAYTMLRIGIECKDNSLPFVLFGSETRRAPQPEYIDDDTFYCQISTSRDKGFLNRFSIPIFGNNDSYGEVKKFHHQFNDLCRYYSVSHVEKKGKESNPFLKLHQSDSLAYATKKLGAFIGEETKFVSGQDGKNTGKLLEEAMQAPIILITFTMLAHTVPHFRYCNGHNSPEKSNFSSVFMNRSYDGKHLSYVVDFVSENALDEAINKIESSFNKMIEKTVPYVISDH